MAVKLLRVEDFGLTKAEMTDLVSTLREHIGPAGTVDIPEKVETAVKEDGNSV